MFSFWKNIIRRALNAAEKEIGVKGLFIDLLIALVTLCIYWLAKGRPPIGELGEGALIAIYVYIGVIIITSAFYIFREPAALDKEQKDKIRSLEKRINNKTIKTKKIRFLPKEERSRRSDELGHYAYLEIFNGEDDDLGECYVTLNKVYLLTEDSHLDVLHHINPNLSYLTWPAFNRGDEKIIRAKKAARINVAKTVSNNIAFILEDGDHQGLSPFAMDDYYIEIEINGILNKTPIQGVVFKGFIHYISILSGETDRPPQISYRLYIEEGEYTAGKSARTNARSVKGT